MTVYSIFENPQAKREKNRGPIAVPERFSWFATLLPPIYALAYGLWLLLLFWVALVIGLWFAGRYLGADAVGALYALVVIFLGFEAPALRRDQMLFRGLAWRGDVISNGPDLALRDYLLSLGK